MVEEIFYQQFRWEFPPGVGRKRTAAEFLDTAMAVLHGQGYRRVERRRMPIYRRFTDN